MKKIITASAFIFTALGVINATPMNLEDRRWDCKTPYYQTQQQSGWDLCADDKVPATPKVVSKTAEKSSAAPAPAATPTPAPTSVPQQTPKAVPAKEWVLTGVQFESGSDKLKSGSSAKLDEAVQILKDNASVRVQIQGHTDNMGDPEFNQALSEKRAVSVKTYLVSKGIDANRLETTGFGENVPLADNETADGRANNRRIEFRVLNK
jgi:outer membrane protein OmpA-like peptidoglycan-associated protein